MSRCRDSVFRVVTYLVAAGSQAGCQIEVAFGVDDLWLYSGNSRNKRIDRRHCDSLAFLTSAASGWSNWVVLGETDQAVVGFRRFSCCYESKGKNGNEGELHFDRRR